MVGHDGHRGEPLRLWLHPGRRDLRVRDIGLGLTIAGVTIGAEYVGDYIRALAFGIVFQYFAIAPMRGLGLMDGLIAAAKADFISLTAFEIGLFGWMAIMAFVLFPAPHHLMPTSAATGSSCRSA
jgi:hypothetical protein